MEINKDPKTITGKVLNQLDLDEDSLSSIKEYDDSISILYLDFLEPAS